MIQMAWSRVALGTASFLAPAVTARLLGLGQGADPGRDQLARMFAAREIVLGAGYLISKESGRRTWARLGLVVDALDTVAGLKGRSSLPFRAVAGITGAAVGATALGTAKVAKDLR
ncbi:hypothetical protein DPM19_06845 [Actinomadura craniellae]|uniref:DUF4267 domain-containing protein n=2 Tax=Actinomadura craniellae TaxID=2231787 RepID=A0A365H983_9ACTN|nr:hypothetical protein DPM19_06845 [Actinomadura craniellae]